MIVWKVCAAGAALLTQPMDVVKTKMQAQCMEVMERVARFIECELRARAATLSSRWGTYCIRAGRGPKASNACQGVLDFGIACVVSVVVTYLVDSRVRSRVS